MTLIRGAEIIDGTGAHPRRADVLIRGERISAIGSFTDAHADTVIEATGSYLCPGFIDVHATSDHFLGIFTNPGQESFLRQGITTIVGGHGGFSLAPLLYGSLEDLRSFADPRSVNVHWHTLKEFLGTLERHPLGVNFATFVGYATIRNAVRGRNPHELTVHERQIVRRLLQESLEAGALGFSTDLSAPGSRSTSAHELVELGELTSRYGGVHAIQLRGTSLPDNVTEALYIQKQSGARMLISRFRPPQASGAAFEKSLKLIQAVSPAVLRFESFPDAQSLVPLYGFLPAWAREETLEQALLLLKENDHALSKELSVKNFIVVSSPRADYLVGISLRDFSEARGLDLRHGLMELMRLTKLEAAVLEEDAHHDLAIQSLIDPHALIGSNVPSLEDARAGHERFRHTFPFFLRTLTGSRMLSLAEAVHRVTGAPAAFLKLSSRGTIRERAIADLVLMKSGAVTDVFVAGKRAIARGIYQNSRTGSVLRRTA